MWSNTTYFQWSNTHTHLEKSNGRLICRFKRAQSHLQNDNEIEMRCFCHHLEVIHSILCRLHIWWTKKRTNENEIAKERIIRDFYRFHAAKMCLFWRTLLSWFWIARVLIDVKFHIKFSVYLFFAFFCFIACVSLFDSF